MNKIEINIGLNNNPCTAQENVMYLVSLYTSVKHNVQLGEWDGGDEPTLVVELFSDINKLELREFVEFYTIFLTQEAIPFRFNGVGELVFNESYEGERYPFDEKYFLTIK